MDDLDMMDIADMEEVCEMPTSGEVIEKLSRQLERVRILNDLKSCHTLEDFQKLTEKYEAICSKDEN